MGNKISRAKNDNEIDNIENLKLPNLLDHIASSYITTQKFTDLEKLYEKEYCDKLIILTSKIIDKYFNNLEIDYLDQRTKNGVEINKMTRQKIIYMTDDDLNSLKKITPLKKKRMCMGISKFYIKIAHIFAAITKTINPSFSYTNNLGKKEIVSLMEKHKIPKNIKTKITKCNLCSRRIHALMTRQNNQNGIVIKPKNCNMNKKYMKKNAFISGGGEDASEPPSLPIEMQTPKVDNKPPVADTLNLNNGNNDILTSKSLFDEPGIPELENLYYDVFDFNKGIYNSMSDNNKNDYNNDLLLFYKTLTGKNTIPIIKDQNGNNVPSIKKFSDIKLTDFHNQILCLEKNDEKYNNLTEEQKQLNNLWKKSHGPSKSKLFVEYAEHLANMIKKTKESEKQLINILEEIFVYWIDPKVKKKTLTINPKLNIDKLEEIIKKTRNIIMKLYIECEKDFQKGLNIFEAIIKKKILELYKNRTKNLETLADKISKTK